jgi:hypothetical protein
MVQCWRTALLLDGVVAPCGQFGCPHAPRRRDAAAATTFVRIPAWCLVWAWPVFRASTEAVAGSPIVQATRLVPSPIFILSAIRSGSTLLRCILNTHPALHASHELHLTDLTVALTTRTPNWPIEALCTHVEELEHMLWDRRLHRELIASGKTQIIEKTPGNVFHWRQLRQCWPDARYVFLLRDPLHVAASAFRTRDYPSWTAAITNVTQYLDHLCAAMRVLPGLTVRYEQLTAAPQPVTQELCDYLGVTWQDAMLRYGDVKHGPFGYGSGDFTDRIRSGRIDPRPIVLPGDCEPDIRLTQLRTRLGY